MNQYERLLKRQKKMKKGKICFIILTFIIIILFTIIGTILIGKNYNIYLIAFIMFILPIIIPLSFILYTENKIGGIEERRGFIKIIPKGNAVIEINNGNKEALEQSIKEFTLIYKNKDIMENNYDFKTKTIGNKLILLFNKQIEFKTFSFIINYLSFLDNKKYNVTGRYPGEMTAAKINKPITRETQKNIMVFCKDDKKDDINSVYCYCDNGLFIKKYLYINKLDNPPYYKYMQLIQQTPGFEYREIPTNI